jgi:Na+-driven multidrug efflux pump
MSESDQYYASYYGDDYYYYLPDDSETSLPANDPGPFLLIITVVCCFSCIAILPLLLRWGAQYDQYKLVKKNEKEQFGRSRPAKISESDIYSRRDGVEERVEHKRKARDCLSLSSIKEEEMTDVPCIGADWPRSDYSVASSHASSRTSKSLSTFIESVITCHPRSKRHGAMAPNDRLMTLSKVLVKEEQIDIALIDDYTAYRSTLSPLKNKRKSATSSRASVKSLYGGGSSIGHLDIVQESVTSDVQSKKSNSELRNVGAQIASAGEVQDLRICCGRDALWKPRVIRRAFDDLVLLFEKDHETKRIISLALPFTLSEVVMGVCENIHMALISRYMGTGAVAAITAVDLFLSITGGFLGGIIDGQLSITSHAIGVGNNYLAGQYVQQAQILTTIGYLPSYALWWFCVYPATLWLGMRQNVAIMAQQYARVELVNDWLDCMSNSIHGMYEVTDHEWFSNISDIVFEFFGIAAIVPTLIYYKKVDLITLAYIDMGLEVLGIIWAVAYGACKGWLKPFVSGWLFNFALFNTKALCNMVSTALPLMVGELVSEAEWEIFTIFAAHNGQSEVAAWGLMGSLWETFEAFHEGIGDAAEIRVAYHLGKGSPHLALTSGLKGAIIATATAFTTTSFLWIFGEEIPKWFSKGVYISYLRLFNVHLM